MGGKRQSRSTSGEPKWNPLPNALGIAAVTYIAVDYLRELNPPLHEKIQPWLWGFLALACALRAPFYPYWKREVKSIGPFVLSVFFMLGALTIEAFSVQFVTTVLGLDWHWKTSPLPDTGQWLLLYLNEKLPIQVVELLRAPLVGLHHYLILFLMLCFSVLFGCAKAPGVGIGARYMTSMGIGRLLRVMTFLPTILPSARPWCAHARFRTASHPHPWAQKYFTPYTSDPELVRKLLKVDEAFAAPVGDYPPEFVPNWGSMQFLVNILRPPDPAVYPNSKNESWFTTLKRAGGGCNDLIFSGHILVSVLTAMAWTEAYPGWTSGLIWVLVLHSAQREIRERHHYSTDVTAGLYMGVFLWWLTSFIWSKNDERKALRSKLMMRMEDALVKAAKDGDIEKIRTILSDVEKAGQESLRLETKEKIIAGTILGTTLGMALLAFVWTANG
ncbi:hypothetical protein Mapa_014990 [Marchantia paleacea]|nr:hypothetical protein Mapa_014990 [Marchantia paleacea]